MKCPKIVQDYVFVETEQSHRKPMAPSLQKERKRYYLFFHRNTKTAATPIAPTARVPPTIPYSSMLEIPWDDLLTVDVALKVTSFKYLLPLTIMEPDTVDTEYPVTLLTLYEYDPLGSENEIVSVVEDSFFPLSVTDHEVPDGRPDSENVIVY